MVRICLFFLTILSFAQPLNQKENFTRQDSLRGSNNEFRNWWDVKSYDLVIRPDFDKKTISGSVRLSSKIIKQNNDFVMQIDLQEPMQIDRVSFSPKSKKSFEEIPMRNITREGNVYFIPLHGMVNDKVGFFDLLIYFSGKPKIAKNPPWDGGWIFIKDKKGRPWMSVACQGLGASVWFPNKDYLGDEPDEGINLEITVEGEGFKAIGNGQTIGTRKMRGTLNTRNTYYWQVKNPINNYNIIPYIGHYVHFNDLYIGEKDALYLDYWVLDYNLEKAKEHFKQTKSVLKTMEKWFGPYPFYEDGYKLVESPYLGMEHQSNIAYGNGFQNGYFGSDLSGTGHGLAWDFIIVHETGHEWFGNNISVKDIADLWVHEGFTMYSEVLYTQELLGKKAGDEYAKGLRKNILNDIPIIGQYVVNQEGSGDMYYKGAAMIHTLRQLMEDDEKFRQMLRGLNKEFYHKTVTTQQIEDYMSEFTGKDLTAFFNQYLRTTKVPTLEIKVENKIIFYRYTNVVEDFDMPLELEIGEWIFPTKEWKEYIGDSRQSDFRVNKNFYIKEKWIN